MNVLNYMLLKLANLQPAPPPEQGGLLPAPPPPPLAVAMQTVPAGPGEMPATEKKYKLGDGDFKIAMQGLNNLIYSLNRRQAGDMSALQQFDRSKMASMNKLADLHPFSNVPVFGDGLNKAYNWISRQAGGIQNLANNIAAGKDIVLQLPEANENMKWLNSIVTPLRKAYEKDGTPGLVRNLGNRLQAGSGDALVDTWLPRLRRGYGAISDFLGTDYTGTGYLQNWKIGLGLIGAYGAYRMLANNNEEDERKHEIEELRKLRLEAARQNLYNQRY